MPSVTVTATEQSKGVKSTTQTNAEGVYSFLALPAGRYQVSARNRHVTETKQVVVPQQGSIDVRLYWDDSDRQDVKVLCRRCSKRSQQ